MPTKESHKYLFEAITKQKVKESIATTGYIDKQTRDRMDSQKKFMGEFLSKTQHIREEGAQSVLKWQQRMKVFEMQDTLLRQ